MGRYDLILLDERADLSFLQEFYQSNLTHVKDWLPIWGMKWATNRKKHASPSEEDKILGISFVKLDIDHALHNDTSPVEEEEAVARMILSETPGTPYCSFGLNELLVVNYAKSFGDLAQKVVALKKVLIESGKRRAPLALDVCTLPAIEYNALIERNIRNRITDPIEAILLLSLQIDLDSRFKKTLRRMLHDNLRSNFGAHDVTLRLQGATDKVMRDLEGIRAKGAKYGLHSSFTILHHPDMDLQFDIAKSPIQNTLTDEQGTDDIIDDRFRFYRRSVQASIRDPMTKHVFADQVAFFKDNEELKKTVKEDPGTLETTLECLRIGFEQRLSAVDPGNLLGARSIRTEHLGSLQRVNMAIESLPAFMFEKLGYGRWPGFCINGYVGRFYRAEGGIINFPYKFRTDPEMYWGIIHEIGHEIFLRIGKGFKSRLRDEIQELIDSVIRAYRREKSVDQRVLQEEYTNFVEEVFAEIFGFHFGFNDKWRLYVSKVWTYFAEEPEIELDFLHVSRSVLVYFTFGPGKNLARDQITPSEVDKCVREIDKATRKKGIRIEKDDWERTIPITMAFLNIADIIRTDFLRRPLLYQDRELRIPRSVLRKGGIFYSDNPLEILFSFTTSRYKKSWKRRTAAILSLYNCYTGHLKRMMEEEDG